MKFKKLKLKSLSVFLLIILFLSSCSGLQELSVKPDSSELRIHIIDVGNADAVLVLNGDSAMLIDAGENNDGDDVAILYSARASSPLIMQLPPTPMRTISAVWMW